MYLQVIRLVTSRGYHGCTNLTVQLSEYKFGKAGLKQDFVHVIPAPDYYRYGYLELNFDTPSEEVVAAVNNDILARLKGTIAKIKANGKRLAAFIMESGMSVAGGSSCFLLCSAHEIQLCSANPSGRVVEGYSYIDKARRRCFHLR